MPKPPKPTEPPRELPRRRHWKESKARKVLADFAASGESLTEYARGKGLLPQRLRRWQQKLGWDKHRAQPPRARTRRGSTTPATTARVPPATPASPSPPLLELHPSPDARRGAAIEIVLSSGVTLRVAETIEPAALARLVAALERGC